MDDNFNLNSNQGWVTQGTYNQDPRRGLYTFTGILFNLTASTAITMETPIS